MNKNIFFKLFNFEFVNLVISGALVLLIASNNKAFNSLGLWIIAVLLSIMLFRFNEIFWRLQLKDE